MHPSFGLEREYAVRVLGALSDDEKQRLLDGVAIDGGRPARFNTLDDETGPGGKSSGEEGGVNRWYRVTIAEGRNREVRRMIEAAGHAVSRLIRIRYGVFALPKGLKRGAWIELDLNAIRALGEAVGAPEQLLRRRPQAAADKPARRGRGDRSKASGPRPDLSNPKRAQPRRDAGWNSAPEGGFERAPARKSSPDRAGRPGRSAPLAAAKTARRGAAAYTQENARAPAPPVRVRAASAPRGGLSPARPPRGTGKLGAARRSLESAGRPKTGR
jgi:23S rRNA pseudouridine2605 synthase